MSVLQRTAGTVLVNEKDDTYYGKVYRNYRLCCVTPVTTVSFLCCCTRGARSILSYCANADLQDRPTASAVSRIALNSVLGAATVGALNWAQHSEQNEPLVLEIQLECCSRHRANRLRLLFDLVLFDEPLEPGNLHIVLFDNSLSARYVLQ